jgi:hypothetical protein
MHREDVRPDQGRDFRHGRFAALDTEGIYTEVTSIIAERYGRTFDWSVKQNIIGRGAAMSGELRGAGAGSADQR